MAKITKINSKKALISLDVEELTTNDLLKWVRGDSKGIGNRTFISEQPIEAYAAKVYKEKYPSDQVKIAEKMFLNDDHSVDIILRVTAEYASDMYNHHPVKLIYGGKPEQRKLTASEVIDITIPDVEFLLSHIAELNKDELDMLDAHFHIKKSAVEILADAENTAKE